LKSEILANRLREIGIKDLKKDEPLTLYSSWKIGGPADVLVNVSDIPSLQKLIVFAKEWDVPFIVIGKGSNILFPDEGLRGIVAKFGKSFASVRTSGTSIIADAGVWTPHLAKIAASKGISGLEHVSGIPGTLGGLIYMNGGSLRRSIGDNIKSVLALDEGANLVKISRDKCEFSYRSSLFQRKNYVILKACIEGKGDDPKNIKRRILDILAERKRKFPLKLPSCGSVFTNNARIYEAFGPPGKIIEEAGLKGLCVGGLMVSPMHANFIVNIGGGRCKDAFELISMIRETVHKRTGFWLECEVRYVTPMGKIAPLHEFL